MLLSYLRSSVVLGTILIIGPGCMQSTSVPPTSDFCALYEPVLFSEDDLRYAQQLVDDSMKNNAVFERLCANA
jgi:hypothetical protein